MWDINLYAGFISPSMPTTKRATNVRAGVPSRPLRRRNSGTSPGRGPFSGGKSRFLSGSERLRCPSHRIIICAISLYYTPCILARKRCNGLFSDHTTPHYIKLHDMEVHFLFPTAFISKECRFLASPCPFLSCFLSFFIHVSGTKIQSPDK